VRGPALLVASGFLIWDSCRLSQNIMTTSDRNIILARNPNTVAAISALVLSCVEMKMMDANKNTHPVPIVI